MRKLLLTLLFLTLGSGTLPPPSVSAQMFAGRQLVQADLIADTTAIQAGKPFMIGLRLKMEKGWHTYWRYSGDAGMPTELKLNLPSGWQVGPLRWPVPLRLVEPGDIVVYGYKDEVLLMQEVTPPIDLAGETAAITGAASWLVCEKTCIPGDAKLALNLPIGPGAAANEELFRKYGEQLPEPWPEDQVAETTWSREAGDLKLTVKSDAFAGQNALQFFPIPTGEVELGHVKAEKVEERSYIFRVPLDGESVTSLGGLIVFEPAAGESARAWQLEPQTAVRAAAAGIATVAPSLSVAVMLKFLVLGFLGGIILNLMPCVLPVISLKIFSFIQHAGQSRARIFRSGLMFSAGVFTWFVGLALLMVLLKSAGQDLTWGAFQFTNPYFVLFLCVVLLVFALNLLGVFEITLPQSANRGLLGVSDVGGDVGFFFQGIVATVLATPCTAPFLGTALGFAFTQSSLMIILMFVAIAAGMSLPFLLLTAQPAWLRYLPKPGPWMEHLKHVMGFVLLATLLFLLSVLGAQRGPAAIIWTSAFLLLLSIACWMKGAFLTPKASLSQRIVSYALIAVLILGGSFYLIGDKFRATKTARASTLEDGDWIAFTPERLQAELDKGSAVFLDFTAAWCVTCKFNEATVLETEEVRQAFQRNGIVKIKADWTNADPQITRLLKQFGRPGVPLYVLYPAGKPDEPVILPELLTKTIVLDRIENLPTRVAAQ